MTRVTDLWRHPIKSHGTERLESTTVVKGHGLPWDRRWAVAHDAAKLDHNAPQWARCSNFSRGAKAPALMAISATSDIENGKVTLTQPDAGSITFDPDNPADEARFINWVTPLCPPDRAQPTSIYSAPDTSLTDSSMQSISIGSHSSLRALSQKAGHDLSPLRFRINIWLDDDLAPWQEFEWIGKTIHISDVAFQIVKPIERCNATKANPDTGRVDVDTLAVLNEGWGHQDFGLQAIALSDGKISIGDALKTS
jgi:uncharacterized protein YcbX